MQIEAANDVHRSRISRTVVFAAMAVCVIGLQIGLPLTSYQCAGQRIKKADAFNHSSDDNDFWRERLRFAGLLDVPKFPHGYFDFTSYSASAAVCNDELIVLCQHGAKGPGHPDVSHINLSSGHVTTSVPPVGVSGLLSNGTKLWWLPKERERKKAFVFEGRPSRFESSYETTVSMLKLMELTDGEWKSTGQVGCAPLDNIVNLDVEFDVDRLGRLTGFACDTVDTMHFRMDVEIESEAEKIQRLYAEVEGSDQPIVEPDVERLGWSKCQSPMFGYWPGLGYWVEGNIVSVLHFIPEENELHSGGPGFIWQRFSESKSFEPVLIPPAFRISPFNSAERSGGGTNAGPFRIYGLLCVKSADGRIYVVIRNLRDGRWTVLRFENGQLQQVVNQRSPLLGAACLDGCLLFGISFVIPMLLLGSFASYLQRGKKRRTRDFAHESVVLASVFQRGAARMIDLTLIVLPIGLSIVLHPDAMDWWMDVITASSRVGDSIQRTFVNHSSVISFEQIKQIQEIFTWHMPEFFPIPTISWLLLVAASILTAQIIWQARTGQTLGKWLLRLKVLRTTLRPCGLVRSLLREVLVLIDSVFLLSWVPAVISILATRNSQRLGDLLSDTIVVDESLAK